MKSAKLLAVLAVIFYTTSMCFADEITKTLTAERKIQTQPLKYEQQEIPDNSEVSDNPCDIAEEYVLPVFKPYERVRGEVILGSTKNWINAINPNAWNNRIGAGFPGGRGPNQLVIYTPQYGVRTNTNEFGAEAVVEGNTVTELTGADSFIPNNGIVISGHGQAKKWMNSSLSVGTKIYIDKETNSIYTYTTSESFVFETEKKISESEQMLEYYKSITPDYNWKIPYMYINDAKEYLKKAQKYPEYSHKYSQQAIDSANFALKSVLPYKNNELKGIWLRPTERTEKEIIDTVVRLHQAGIDNIFIETYYHGKTIFPSETMKAYNFTEQYEQFEGIDPLAIYIREAHKRNMKVHAWFETFYVGNENPDNSPNSILAMNPSWGNKTRKDADSVTYSKSVAEHNGYFLDPANPYVQDFVVKLAEEIITRYKPDGINIDYIRYPNSVGNNDNSNWGYTEFARNDFFMIYGIDPIVIKRTDPEWQDWNNYRREQITNVVKKIGQLGRRNGTYISAVIFPDRQAALINKQQDWKTWSTRGYIDGITPLFLTCDSKTANKMMTDVIKFKSPNTDFYAGLFVTFMGGSDEDLIRQIHEARKVNAKGVIIFDYAHLNNKYINTLSTSVFSSKNPIKPAVNNPQITEKRRGWHLFGKN